MPHPLLRRFAFIVTLSSVLVGLPAFGMGNGTVHANAASPADCSGSNFLGAWVGVNGATGTSIYQVAFINDGHTTCRLAGFPKILGYRDGREYTLTTGHIRSQVFDISPTVVAPRMSGLMVLTTSALCNSLNSGDRSSIQRVIARSTYGVRVEFPHSSVPVEVHGLNLDVACGLNVTALGWR